jgi:hypothetical protein
VERKAAAAKGRGAAREKSKCCDWWGGVARAGVFVRGACVSSECAGLDKCARKWGDEARAARPPVRTALPPLKKQGEVGVRAGRQAGRQAEAQGRRRRARAATHTRPAAGRAFEKTSKGGGGACARKRKAADCIKRSEESGRRVRVGGGSDGVARVCVDVCVCVRARAWRESRYGGLNIVSQRVRVVWVRAH